MKLNFLSLKPTTPQCLQKLMHRQTEIPRQAETQRIRKMPLLQEQRQYIKMQPKMMPTQQIAQRQSGRLQTKRAGQSERHIKLALQTTLRLRSFAFELFVLAFQQSFPFLQTLPKSLMQCAKDFLAQR